MTFSPRLWQVQERLPYTLHEQDHAADIAIIGGGIAGLMTAYMLLMHTSHKVTLIEAKRLAHGATGHNAGQVASYFEKPFDEIVEEYGFEKAWQGQEALITGRELLEEILLQEKMTVPYEKTTGYAAFSTIEQLIEHLRRKHLRDAGGMVFDSILVVDHLDREKIPSEYRGYITAVSQEQLSGFLQTDDLQYIAAGASTKGTINSALLCEELAHLLRVRFPHSFIISEHTQVNVIDISKATAELHVTITDEKAHRIWTANNIILCTNGYKNFTLRSNSPMLEEWFGSSRHGIVGYMIGAFTDLSVKSGCISYFPMIGESLLSGNDGEIYYYMTVRKFAGNGLVCLGGPEKHIGHAVHRISHDEVDHHTITRQDHQKMITFLQDTRNQSHVKHTDFTRHGLMGYTKSRFREIGPDPEDSRLRYNLGCNGVGICSSVYGAWKIMKIIQGESFPPSIFDIIR